MLWLTLLLGTLAFASPKIDDNIGGTEYLQTPQGMWPSLQLRHPQPLEQEMDYEKLLTLIKDRGITSIEALVAALPYEMRDSNYVVMYRSRSLQAATPQSPRIISFTPTARFLLSFNGGEPGVRGGDTVEIIQYRMPEARFEFRELTFDGKSAPRASEANPRKCMECHQGARRVGVDMRPNWEPYNAWPGALGSADGGLRGDFSFVRDKRNELQDEPMLAEHKEEASIAYAFTKLAANHPRYRSLETLNPHVTSELADRLAPLNFSRVMRLMRENKEVYEANRELIAAFGLCDSSAELNKIMLPYSQRAPWRYAQIDTTYALSRRITWLNEGLGIDTSDWSMDFGSRGRFAAFERFGTPSNPPPLFQWAWEQNEPDAEAMKRLGCRELLKTAEAKVAAYIRAGTPGAPGLDNLRPRATAEGVLARCARCHTGARPIAPPIPFDDSGALRASLDRITRSGRRLNDEVAYRTSDMATRDEQMPPGAGRLSTEENSVLMDYFRKLREGR